MNHTETADGLKIELLPPGLASPVAPLRVDGRLAQAGVLRMPMDRHPIEVAFELHEYPHHTALWLRVESQESAYFHNERFFHIEGLTVEPTVFPFTADVASKLVLSMLHDSERTAAEAPMSLAIFVAFLEVASAEDNVISAVAIWLERQYATGRYAPKDTWETYRSLTADVLRDLAAALCEMHREVEVTHVISLLKEAHSHPTEIPRVLKVLKLVPIENPIWITTDFVGLCVVHDPIMSLIQKLSLQTRIDFLQEISAIRDNEELVFNTVYLENRFCGSFALLHRVSFLVSGYALGTSIGGEEKVILAQREALIGQKESFMRLLTLLNISLIKFALFSMYYGFEHTLRLLQDWSKLLAAPHGTYHKELFNVATFDAILNNRKQDESLEADWEIQLFGVPPRMSELPHCVAAKSEAVLVD